MYRFLFRPKWILFHVAVIAAVVGMLSLARWQWNKHLDRDAFAAKVHARQDAEPTELAPLMASKSAADIEYFRVTATGEYLRTGQLTEINVTQGSVNGVNVITPFQVDGGPVVIVNRGFVPDGTSVPPPPDGTFLIGGTARTSEHRHTGEISDSTDSANTQVRRVDLVVIAKILGRTVSPVYIDLIGSKPTAPSPPTPVPAPNLSGGPPHVSYTVQWIIFSIAAIVGWVLAVRRSVRTRRAAGVAGEADVPLAAVSADDPAPPSA